MKSLRLLITKDCINDCKGCCNKDWDLQKLPVETDFAPYDEIMLTGGEPLLYPYAVMKTIQDIRQQNNKAKIILYTANFFNAHIVGIILNAIDGLTFTIHKQKDVSNFSIFNDLYQEYPLMFQNKSMRLNVFKGINISFLNLEGWKIKKDIVWIKNCPLPTNEVFKRI